MKVSVCEVFVRVSVCMGIMWLFACWVLLGRWCRDGKSDAVQCTSMRIHAPRGEASTSIDLAYS